MIVRALDEDEASRPQIEVVELALRRAVGDVG
jgi:hypothetical protein